MQEGGLTNGLDDDGSRRTHPRFLVVGPVSEGGLFQCALWIHEKALGTKHTGSRILNQPFRELATEPEIDARRES